MKSESDIDWNFANKSLILLYFHLIRLFIFWSNINNLGDLAIKNFLLKTKYKNMQNISIQNPNHLNTL